MGDSLRRQANGALRWTERKSLERAKDGLPPLILDDKLRMNDLEVSAFRGKSVGEAGELGAFLTLCRQGVIPSGSFLLVESLDRVSRMTPRRVQRILDDIVDAGVIIVTLNDRQEYSQDRLDSDPTALLIALMVSWHAHEESKVKAQRLSAAWAEKRRRVRDGTDAHRAITRAVPLSGTVSQVNANIAGNATEATGFMDRLFKVTPGLGAYLPARIDALGNEVDGRVMGLAAGTTSDTDPLTSRIAALGIDITNLRKADPAGFDLTGEELSELRRIRATEATNADGLTMRETLEELLDDPEFQALPSRDQKQAEVVAVMGKFNEPARELFEERNQQYLADREGNRSLKAYIAEGIERDEAAGMAREDVVALELPEPSRLPQ